MILYGVVWVVHMIGDAGVYIYRTYTTTTNGDVAVWVVNCDAGFEGKLPRHMTGNVRP